MINKIGNFLEKHKYAISIFLFFIAYNFVVVGNFSFPSINELCYIYHIVDYNVGFCPELLPGAIYNLIFSTTKEEVVNLYVIILYHLFLIVVSVFLDKFINKFDSENRFNAFVIVLFYITGPSTFAVHATEIGMLDMYWLFLAAILLIIVQNKYSKWLIPVVFVLAVFIHVGSLISFIPFFALIVLFEASKDKKVSKSFMLIFFVSVILAIGLFVYFVAFEESNLFLTRTEFRQFIRDRNISQWEDNFYYYEYALYRIAPDGTRIFPTTVTGGSLAEVLDSFIRQIKVVGYLYPRINKQYFVDFAINFFVSMPVIVFLYKILVSFFKKEKGNHLRRFVWFCGLCLLPFTFIVSLFCSPDLNKWFGHGVICMFTLVLYGLYKYSDNEYLASLNNRANKSSRIVIVIYFVLYMLCTVETYT